MLNYYLKSILLAILFAIVLQISASAQGMVKGYFPYYRSVAQANAVQYSQLTDVIYAFADLSATGGLTIRGPGGVGDLSVFNAIKANCTANGVRLWVAVGGWGLSGNFSGVARDYRANFATACLNLCNTHGLAGIDIDWEFPAAGDAANYTAMLAAIKGQLGSTYKLSAALGGESFTYSCVNQGHAVGVQAAAFTHLDFFNIMSYDAPAGCFANHTSVDFMQRSMEGWNAKGCPYSKMIPGIAFYGRPDPDNHLWSIVANAAHFTDADGIVNGYGYDTQPTIAAKVSYAMCTRGAPGMMIWEISQDAPSASAYDLLPTVKTAVNGCTLPVSLTHFSATQKDNGMYLKWTTVNEKNNDRFEVERSTDGTSFDIIGTVNGAGNSHEELNYSFTDAFASEGTIYYRLIQYDFDGTKTISAIISSTEIRYLKEAFVSSNPFATETELLLPDQTEYVTVVVADLTGRVVYEQQFSSSLGSIRVGSELQPGVYLLQIQTEDEILSSNKIIKMN